MKAVAVRPFTYVKQPLDRGEIFETKPESPKNAQLQGLRFFVPFDPGQHETKSCDGCGRKFASELAYLEHKKKPTCLSDSQEITQQDVSEMVGRDIRVKD